MGVNMTETDVNRLWEKLAGCPAVEAIALGGSRATGKADENSKVTISLIFPRTSCGNPLQDIT